MKINFSPIIKHDILTLQLTKITATCKTKIPTKTEDCMMQCKIIAPRYGISISHLIFRFTFLLECLDLLDLFPPPTVFLTSHQSFVLS
jgi:hypothetical protein